MQPTRPIMELIANAPWREAVTYRETWPHEYVVVNRDGQYELLAAFCERIGRGEGVECRFFQQKRKIGAGLHGRRDMSEATDTAGGSTPAELMDALGELAKQELDMKLPYKGHHPDALAIYDLLRYQTHELIRIRKAVEALEARGL